MTCIVGVSHRGKVYLAGDSGLSLDKIVLRAATPKVWKVDPFVFGFAGDGQFYTALYGNLDVRAPRGDLDKWMNSDFVSMIGDAISKTPNPDYLEHSDGWELLVGVKGQLYLLSDFSADRIQRNYVAIGGSSTVALGVLFATPGLPPRQRLELALEGAQEFESDIRKPWKFVEV